jgi:hypothetical protein
VLGEKLLKAGAQLRQIAAAVDQHVARRAIREQGQQEVFERDELVPPPRRLLDGQIQCRL